MAENLDRRAILDAGRAVVLLAEDSGIESHNFSEALPADDNSLPSWRRRSRWPGVCGSLQT